MRASHFRDEHTNTVVGDWFFFSWHSLLLQYYLEQTTQILHVSRQTHCPSNRCWWYSSSRVRFRRLTVYLIHRLFFGFSLNRTLAMLAKVCPRSVSLIRLSNIHLLRVLPSLGRFSHQLLPVLLLNSRIVRFLSKFRLRSFVFMRLPDPFGSTYVNTQWRHCGVSIVLFRMPLRGLVRQVSGVERHGRVRQQLVVDVQQLPQELPDLWRCVCMWCVGNLKKCIENKTCKWHIAVRLKRTNMAKLSSTVLYSDWLPAVINEYRRTDDVINDHALRAILLVS